MSLNKIQLLSIICNPSTFYLYKDKADTKDMVKIVNKLLSQDSASSLETIIKAAKDVQHVDLINDDVKTVILTKVLGIYEIAGIFKKYDISVSDALMNKLIIDNIQKTDRISNLLYAFTPHLTMDTIKYIMTMDKDTKIYDSTYQHIANQLIAEKEFKFITTYHQLFRYIRDHDEDTAKEIVKTLIQEHEFDHITKEENNDYSWYNEYLLFDYLPSLMVQECLAAKQPKHIIENTTIWDKIHNISILDPKRFEKRYDWCELMKKTTRQLIDMKEFDFLIHNSKTQSYLIETYPELLKEIPYDYYIDLIKSVESKHALKLMNLMSLPNADLEFAYISANNDATTEFPAREKLSPETIEYINIIKNNDSNQNGALFARLSPRTKSALINCHFDDQGDWYKIMEALLMAQPHLDAKYIKQMLDKDRNVKTLIKRYWKGSLTKIRAQQCLSKHKTHIVTMLGINQRKH